ncbi:S-adenosyl-L-methionine-dependent methyltransferase (modular protein) [Frankia sp. Hr75.2]|nr:S-adenosyl-L-methionine-dependent methyltransferase (modular protein) [Frankia sp. Hr75.2]
MDATRTRMTRNRRRARNRITATAGDQLVHHPVHVARPAVTADDEHPHTVDDGRPHRDMVSSLTEAQAPAAQAAKRPIGGHGQSCGLDSPRRPRRKEHDMAEQRSWDIVTGPGLTALGIAASRTVESSMPDALIDDRFGAAFVQAVASPVPFPLNWPAAGEPVTDRQALSLHTSRYIGVRSRFYDDFVHDALRGGVGQVVLLAAGLDTRAFRLGWPGDVTLYELDQPQVLAFKDDVLQRKQAQPGCRRVPVGTDLREEWPDALIAAGFTPSDPTAWIAEGLLGYLPAAAEERLIREIHRLSVPGSRLALDRFAHLERLASDTATLDQLTSRSGIEARALFNTETRPHPAQWLRPNGWTIREDDDRTVAHRYGRDLTDPFTGKATRPWLDTQFLTAELTRT